MQEILGPTRPGATDDLHWVGGWRTSLSDTFCATSPSPLWPYFTPGPAGVPSDYHGCGTDPLHDWVWRRWLQDGRLMEVAFEEGPGADAEKSVVLEKSVDLASRRSTA